MSVFPPLCCCPALSFRSNMPRCSRNDSALSTSSETYYETLRNSRTILPTGRFRWSTVCLFPSEWNSTTRSASNHSVNTQPTQPQTSSIVVLHCCTNRDHLPGVILAFLFLHPKKTPELGNTVGHLTRLTGIPVRAGLLIMPNPYR